MRRSTGRNREYATYEQRCVECKAPADDVGCHAPEEGTDEKADVRCDGESFAEGGLELDDGLG